MTKREFEMLTKQLKDKEALVAQIQKEFEQLQSSAAKRIN